MLNEGEMSPKDSGNNENQQKKTDNIDFEGQELQTNKLEGKEIGDKDCAFWRPLTVDDIYLRYWKISVSVFHGN